MGYLVAGDGYHHIISLIVEKKLRPVDIRSLVADLITDHRRVFACECLQVL